MIRVTPSIIVSAIDGLIMVISYSFFICLSKQFYSWGLEKCAFMTFECFSLSM